MKDRISDNPLKVVGEKESRPGGNDTVGGREKQSKSNIAERGKNVKL